MTVAVCGFQINIKKMRIIGIKILDGEKPVIKNLKVGGWYPFGNYQEPTETNNWQWNKEEKTDQYLSRLYKSSADGSFSGKFQLSVCCIVGKNGSGKSTLLDLMFRVINNFAYVLLERTTPKSRKQNKLPNGRFLSDAGGFAAKLYFETDNKLGYISYSYGNVKYYYYSVHKPGMVEYVFTKYTTPQKLHLILNGFFYTISSNYSIYSFNKNDYETKSLFNKEGVAGVDGNWIHGLLHKNDGYLTPIVITPYRDEEGFIDINNEETLAAQRLSTLAVLFRSQKKSFMGEYSATRLAYQFDEDAQNRYEDKFKKLVDGKLALNAKYSEQFGLRPLKDVVREAWLDFFEKQTYFKKIDDGKLGNTILAYLCYKTLKICLTYPTYGRLMGLRVVKEDELKERGILVVAPDSFVAETNEKRMVTVVRKIAKEDTDNHILLKLRQCLSFMQRDYYKVDSNQHFVNEKDTDIGLHIIEIDKFIQDNLALDLRSAKSKKEKKRKNYQTYDEVFLRMPPSIFKWELRFRKSGSKEEIPLEQLSSGEKQMLQEFSYLLYHIKNIESVENDDYRHHYHHVNIVLDEAELYFHPEFQRQMVSSLIDMLSWCHIDNRKIRSVNIMIVTHSPFVLSDIPANRMLFLREGERVESPGQTFAANYHDLLYNQFIVRSPMGAVAEKAVKHIDDIYRKDKKLPQKELAYQKYIAGMVAERYIREYLLSELDSIELDYSVNYEEDTLSDQ